MEIKLYEDYGLIDADDRHSVDTMISLCDLGDDREIILNFSHCMIGYPNTSLLTDFILGHLFNLSGKKVFRIKTQFDALSIRVLNDIFNGSSHMGFKERSDLIPENEIYEAIKRRLGKREIDVEITLIDYNGEFVKKYF